MQNVCELTHDVEHETLAVEPLFGEPDMRDDERDDERDDDGAPDGGERLNRSERVIASVGAWLVARFANVPGPVFIEDGRLAVYSRELVLPTTPQRRPRDPEPPQAPKKVVH